MLKKYIILVAISFSAIIAQFDSVPEWFLNPPNKVGQLLGIGSGNLKMEAMLNALYDLEQKIEVLADGRTITESYSDSTTSTMSDHFSMVQSTVLSHKLLNKPKSYFKIEGRSESIIEDGTLLFS